MIEIRKGVPMPAPTSKYPWDEMEVGDSFVVPAKTTREKNSVRTAVYNRNRSHPAKTYKTRIVPGGTGVWRVK